MSGVFGVLVAGRLVQTDFEQVDETHFVINLPEPDSIKHAVVFMTGQQPFPSDNLGGAVYIHWPLPNEQQPNWHYLGFVTNQKPSAIFRVAKLKDVAAQQQSSPFGQPSGFPTPTAVQIGISVESEQEIASKSPAIGTEPSTQSLDWNHIVVLWHTTTQKPIAQTQKWLCCIIVIKNHPSSSTFVEFSQKMLKSFINHVSSFAVQLTAPGTAVPTEYVPASAIQEWYNTFERRFAQNPNFWKELNVN